MARYVTVSVKVPREVRDELRRYGVNVGEIVRQALLRALREARLRALKKELARLSPVLERITVDRILESVREDHEQR